MSGLNLHRMVRGAITRVNPDIDGAVYVSTGSTINRGIKTPTFAQLPTQRLQLQQLLFKELAHLNALNVAGNMAKLYAYGEFNAVSRPTGQGGDLVHIRGEWWAVQHVLEWWDDWCCVVITRQLDAENLAALIKALEMGQVPGAPTP